MRQPTIRNALISIALVALGSCTPSVSGSDAWPVVLNHPLVTIDSTTAVLQSSAAQIAQGTFIFGSASTVVVNPGDVIVGSAGDGYLRMVRTVARSGSVLQLETDPAALTDAVRQGGLELPFTAGVPSAALRGQSVMESSMLQGVTVENGRINFRDVQLLGDASNGLAIQNGSLTFSPTGDLELSIRNAAITHLKASVSGSLALDADLVVGASGGFSASDSIPFYSTKKRFFGAIGGVPVYASVVTVFSFVPTIAFDGQASVQTGMTATAGVTVGAEFNDGQWSSLTGPSGSLVVKPLTITVGGRVVGTLGVKAESQIYLYGVAGPYLWAKPFLEADAAIDVLHNTFTSSCKAAVNAGFGMQVKVFDLALVRFIEDRDFLNLPISACDRSGTLTSTGTLSTAGGETQSASAGSLLPTPLVVRVVTPAAAPIAGVSVTFSSPQGGTFVPRTAVTNSSGQASATWTLSSTPGTQTATATANGYNGSPGRFTAIGTNTTSCPPISYSLGQALSGVITSSDCRYFNTQQSYDNYSLILPAAQTLRFTMSSNVFVANNTVNIDPAGRVNTGFTASAVGQTVSEKVVAPAGNVYIRPAAAVVGATGAYTFLTVATSEEITGCENVVLMSGATASQQLTSSDCNRSGHYADRYQIALEPGATATLLMQSGALDAALTLTDYSGALLVNDDDSGGGTDAKIVYVNNTSSILGYFVYATSTRAGAQGSYQLSLVVGSPSGLRSGSEGIAGSAVPAKRSAQ